MDPWRGSILILWLLLKAILTEEGYLFPRSRGRVSRLQVTKSLTKVQIFFRTGFSNVKTPGKHPQGYKALKSAYPLNFTMH